MLTRQAHTTFLIVAFERTDPTTTARHPRTNIAAAVAPAEALFNLPLDLLGDLLGYLLDLSKRSGRLRRLLLKNVAEPDQ